MAKSRNGLRDRIKDGLWQYMQFLLLLVCLLLPSVLKFQKILNQLIDNAQKPDWGIAHILLYYLIKRGDVYLGIALLVACYFFLSKNNANNVLNNGNRYHDHCYIYYWLCSHILGYKKCSLIRVPVFMQFILVLNDTFREFSYGDDDTYQNKENDEIKVTKENGEKSLTNLVNIVISDTYPVTTDMLPHLYSMNTTIIIQRKGNIEDRTRYYSQKLINEVTNELRLMSGVHSVNVFATTNPKNTYNIANKVFKTAGRDNIEHLSVFKQSIGEDNHWKFDDIGVKIY